MYYTQSAKLIYGRSHVTFKFMVCSPMYYTQSAKNEFIIRNSFVHYKES